MIELTNLNKADNLEGNDYLLAVHINELNAAVRELQMMVGDILKETGMEHLPHPRTGNLKSNQ